MLRVCVIHEREAAKNLRGILEPGLIDGIELDVREVHAESPQWPTPDVLPHLLLLLVQTADPNKTRTRTWLRDLLLPAEGRLRLPVVFVGNYAAAHQSFDATWIEEHLSALPSSPVEMATWLIELFADLAGPRVLVIDDEPRHLPCLTLPFLKLGDWPTWIIPIHYQVAFQNRHQPEARSHRQQVLRLTQSVLNRQPTIVLLDVVLGEKYGFEECRALATEILLYGPGTRILPVSLHAQDPAYARTFAVLAQLFPGRVYPVVNKDDFRQNQLEASLNAYLARTVDSPVPRKSKRSSLLTVSVPAAASEASLRLGILTWLSFEQRWILDSVERIDTDTQVHLLYSERKGVAGAPHQEHVKNYLPALSPPCFFTDWEPRRLAAARNWWVGTESSHLVKRTPLLRGRPDITAACYIDLDAIRSHHPANPYAVAQRTIQYLADLRDNATSNGRSFKTWFVCVGNTQSVPSKPVVNLLSEINKRANDVNLFDDSDLDYLEIRVAPTTKEAADSALLTLVKADNFTTHKVFVISDRKLLDMLLLEGGNCERLHLLTDLALDRASLAANVTLIPTSLSARGNISPRPVRHP